MGFSLLQENERKDNLNMQLDYLCPRQFQITKKMTMTHVFTFWDKACQFSFFFALQNKINIQLTPRCL